MTAKSALKVRFKRCVEAPTKVTKNQFDAGRAHAPCRTRGACALAAARSARPESPSSGPAPRRAPTAETAARNETSHRSSSKFADCAQRQPKLPAPLRPRRQSLHPTPPPVPSQPRTPLLPNPLSSPALHSPLRLSTLYPSTLRPHMSDASQPMPPNPTRYLFTRDSPTLSAARRAHPSPSPAPLYPDPRHPAPWCLTSDSPTLWSRSCSEWI